MVTLDILVSQAFMNVWLDFHATYFWCCLNMPLEESGKPLIIHGEYFVKSFGDFVTLRIKMDYSFKDIMI